jgi:YD repeat-containing protein
MMRGFFRGAVGNAGRKDEDLKASPTAPSLYVPPAHRYSEGGIAPVVLSALPPFILSAPGSVNVTAASDAQIHVTWSATSTVHHYLIERSTSLSGPFVPIATAASSALSYNDAPPSGVHSYLYRVRAVDMFGAPSPPSNMALGTAIAFTDSTLTAGVTEIKKEHIYDLRHTVDAVRALVPNMGAGSYARSDLYQQIVKAEEINELRNQLKAALDQLNISWPAYQDSPLETGADGTPIRKKHIEQLRERSTYGQSTGSGPADGSMDQSAAKRLDPMNRVGGGDDPLSRNFNWSIPIVSLPGRAGLDLGLGLSYNSLVWTKIDSQHISFDDDGGTPSPGFRLGFPVIKAPYTNSQNTISFLLITPSGARVELRQLGSSTHLYQSVDSSYLLLDTATMILKSTDGSQMSYVWEGSGYECTKIKDRNGNYLTIHYDDTLGRLDWVEDTLGRVINFDYDSGYLSAVRQTWKVDGQPTEHYWARFSYIDKPISINFGSLTVTGPHTGQSLHVLSSVKLADNSHYDFDYTSWGQVNKVSAYAGSGTTGNFLNYRSYDLPPDNSASQSDCPRFLHRYDKATNWNLDTSSNPQEVTTATFEAPSAVNIPGIDQPGTLAKVTAPDQTYQKIYYGNSSTNLPWENGLVLLSESYDSASTRQRWVTTTWTQDDAASNVTYQANPRVTSTDIYDLAGNHRQTLISEFSPFGLPHYIDEYGNGAFLRRKIIDYKQDDAYLVDHHIIGFPFQEIVYDANWHLMSRVQFHYDEGNDYFTSQTATAPSTHFENPDYVVGRGNMTGITRFNADNESVTQRILHIGYNQDGSVLWRSDADGHKVTISYADSFSDTNNSLNTRAYPTSATVLETVPSQVNLTSTVHYDYDFGAATSRQTPLPNQTTYSAGPVQTMQYDSIGRLEKITNSVNAAYTSHEYGLNYVKTRSTVNTANDEAYSLQVFDGTGRVIASAGNHPGSSGGYSAQRTVYDTMGRAVEVSNPTETSLSTISTSIVNPYNWSATGDDAGNGWLKTAQTYDWKGRPLVTTSADSKTKTATYEGCGCAGGEVVTLTDEMTRKQKVYSDMLGRQWKAEVLDAGNNVYSATATVYNGRDQVEAVKNYKGAATSDLSCPTNTCMQSVTTYDGYGRLATGQLPQQTGATGYTYNNDDTVATVTDPRGVVATNSYNNRHLLTQISYSVPSGMESLASVTFGYDAPGNRTSMSDGAGNNIYAYDNLSRMTYESRYYNDLSTSYGLTYSYNLAGQLSSITDPANAVVSYTYDVSGRLTTMPGSGYNGVTNFLSSAQYRASGAIKSVTYGDSVQLGLTYTSRLQVAQYQLSSSNFNVATNMTYYDDGRTNTAFYSSSSPFDRKYEFDFAARLKETYSGDEAHGGSAPQLSQANSPYRQTYAYDEWNNVTGRGGRIWTQYDGFSASYGSNNRNANFQYDAAGNTYATGDGNYNYDAAGRPNAFVSLQPWQAYSEWPSGHPNGPSLETQDIFDGSGQIVKHVDHTRHDDSYDSGAGLIYTMTDTTTTTYYVRSTVLGGKTIVELNQNGAKKKGYVYSGSRCIATQEVNGSSNTVALESSNPVTGTKQTTDLSGSYVSSTEPDPMGRDLTSPPAQELVTDPISSPKLNSPMYLEASWGPSEEYQRNNAQRAAEMDGLQLINALKNDFRATAEWILHKNPNVGISLDGQHVAFGDDAANLLHNLRRTEEVQLNPGLLGDLDVAAGDTPQDTGFKIGRIGFPQDKRDRLKRAYDKVTSSGCERFFNDTIAALLNKGELSRDRERPSTLKAVLGVATLNLYSSDITAKRVGEREAVWSDIQDKFDNYQSGGEGKPSGYAFAATLRKNRIFLHDRAFYQSGNIISQMLWNDSDLSGIITHELFHVAGLNEAQVKALGADIQRNCGTPGNSGVAR